MNKGYLSCFYIYFLYNQDVNGPEYYVEAGWIEPQFVPYCLQFNVKKIEILYGDDDPLEPVKYLLKNCGVLDKMIFRYVGKSSNELCKELLMFPRGSKTCEVEFRGKYGD